MTQRLAFRTARTAPEPFEPESLHLWRIPLGALAGDPAALWSVLSGDERAKAERLATETLRERYIRAHGCLRIILGHYLKEDPQEVVFDRSEHGKPSVRQQGEGPSRRLEFNLTGSHDLALVAVSRGRAVGVDCERIWPRREVLGIARRMFSRPIADALARLPRPQQLDAFYAAWTALEAQVKADGRGLFRPRDPSAASLTTVQFQPQPGYLAALAAERLPALHLWGCYEWAGRIESTDVK